MNEFLLIHRQLASERASVPEVRGVRRAALGADAARTNRDGERAQELPGTPDN